MNTQTLQQKYQTEIDRLDQEHVGLQQLWSQVPWFALTAALAPVVGLVWGWGAGVVELLVSAALVATRAYLVSVRITENRWIREKLVDDMDEQGLAREPERGGQVMRLTHATA